MNQPRDARVAGASCQVESPAIVSPVAMRTGFPLSSPVIYDAFDFQGSEKPWRVRISLGRHEPSEYFIKVSFT